MRAVAKKPGEPAEIIDIDNDKQKVSLSIRALLDEAAAAEENADEAAAAEENADEAVEAVEAVEEVVENTTAE